MTVYYHSNAVPSLYTYTLIPQLSQMCLSTSFTLYNNMHGCTFVCITVLQTVLGGSIVLGVVSKQLLTVYITVFQVLTYHNLNYVLYSFSLCLHASIIL